MQVSPELVAILEKMVRYDFRARYVTAADALEALRSLPPELLESVPPPGPLPNGLATASSQELQIPPTATIETIHGHRAQEKYPCPIPHFLNLPRTSLLGGCCLGGYLLPQLRFGTGEQALDIAAVSPDDV